MSPPEPYGIWPAPLNQETQLGEAKKAVAQLVPDLRELAQVISNGVYTQWVNTLAKKAWMGALPLCAHRGVQETGIRVNDDGERVEYAYYGQFDISRTDDDTQRLDDCYIKIEKLMEPLTSTNYVGGSIPNHVQISQNLMEIADRLEEIVPSARAADQVSKEDSHTAAPLLTASTDDQNDLPSALTRLRTLRVGRNEQSGAGETTYGCCAS